MAFAEGRFEAVREDRILQERQVVEGERRRPPLAHALPMYWPPVRRAEYKRLSGTDRAYIKGPRYTLLSRRENLTLDGRRALKKLLQANRRLNTAYVLKEAFGQLWDYRTERGARAFFERWIDSLKWQRLKPYQKFAQMIQSHWDGIASYCHPDNKVSLGMVEGINNKIRVLQRRAYGYRDEEYLKLKIIAAFLPALPRSAEFNPHESA